MAEPDSLTKAGSLSGSADELAGIDGLMNSASVQIVCTCGTPMDADSSERLFRIGLLASMLTVALLVKPGEADSVSHHGPSGQ